MQQPQQLFFRDDASKDFSFDLGDLGFDIEELTPVEQSNTTHKEDLFDFMYSITPLGINFNVILKEQPNTIKNILSLVLSHIEDRGRIKEFFRDCDIFILHMEQVLDNMYQSNHELYDVANDIYLTFKENVNYLRSKLKVYNYNGVAVDGDSQNFNNLIKNDVDNQSAFDVYSITRLDVQNTIRNEIATYKHIDLNNSPIYLYCNEFDSLLTANENISNLMVFVRQLLSISTTPTAKTLKKMMTSGISTKEFADKSPSYRNTIIEMLDYTDTSYHYTEEEMTAMELLGFPTEICNREQFLKPNIEVIIRDKANKTKLVYNEKDFEMRNQQTSKQVLLWLKKAKIYIENKGNRTDMGALYF